MTALAACSSEKKTDPSDGSSPADAEPFTVFAEASVALHPELREDGALRNLYQKREGRSIWIDATAISQAGRETVAELSTLAESRAPERLGRLAELASGLEACRVPGCSEEQLVDLELRLTDALLGLAAVQAHGRPRREGAVGWYLPPREIDVPAVLAKGLGSESPAELMASFDPPTSDRAALNAALTRYRALAAAGGWKLLPTAALEKALRAGESFDATWLALLAERLRAEGYEVPALAVETRVFDGDLVEALRRFQGQHGLVADGNLGKASLEALNVPCADRVRQIEVNLERLRWVKEPPIGRRLEVHVPAFTVELWSDATKLYSTRVIVGKRDWPTPLFEDEVIALLLNPPWNVPDSIAEDEILAKIQADAAYLVEENMVVFKRGGAGEIDPTTVEWAALAPKSLPYRFKQRPGRGNLLGRIKFSLPNHHNIYLHDTPGKSLFERADRALSHGCVRVDEPFALADVLVADLPEWRPGELAKKAATGKELGIRLPQPIPVRMLYTTVRAQEDGTVVFYRDLYGLDAAQ